MSGVYHMEERLREHCAALSLLLLEVQFEHPHACLYLSGGVLHLMSGAPHGEMDGTGGTEAHQERVLCSAALRADGGAW